MITCTITSSGKTTNYEDVKSITLPAYAGEAEILPGHAEAFLLFGEGEIMIERPGNNERVKVKGGEFYVKDDKATIVL
jgi:F0F1-type ATP synthase epsilon subunit